MNKLYPFLSSYYFLCIVTLLNVNCNSKKNLETNAGVAMQNDKNVVANHNNMMNKNNALTPKGIKGLPITITENRASQYKILIPSNPTSQEIKASEELQKWITSITGLALGVVNQVKSNTSYLSVGRTQLYQKEKGSPSINLGEEGYEIAQKGNHLFFIGGSRRGPINAIVAFLEEDLGCRWYTKDKSSHQIPRISNLSITPVLRAEIPAFEMRELMYWDAYDSNWALWNRTNCTRSHKSTMPDEWGGYKNYPKGWSAHTFKRLVPKTQYFESNPDYFAEVNSKGKLRYDPSQICVTNADVKRIAIEKIKKVFTKQKYDLMSISQNDGRYNQCACDECKAAEKSYGGIAGSHLKFVNEIAKEVKKDFPDKMFSTLAYHHTFKPPSIPMEDNVFIELCAGNHWHKRYQPIRQNPEFVKALRDWQKLGTRIHVWDYPAIYSSYLTPFPSIDIFADNLRYYKEQNVQGILFQGKYHDKGTGPAQDAMKVWVWSKLLWDPSRNTDDLVDDFMKGYFKSASKHIQSIHNETYQLIQNIADKTSIIPSNPSLPDDLYQRMSATFLKAYASTSSAQITGRIERFEIPYIYFRLLKKPLGKTDEINYNKDLNRFSQLCEKHDITILSERDMKNGLSDFILKRKIDVTNSTVYDRNVMKSNFYLDETNIRIPKKDAAILVEENDKGTNGYVISIKDLDKPTGIFLKRMTAEELEAGKQYKLKIRVAYTTKGKYKTRKSGEQFPSFQIGLRGIQGGEDSFAFNYSCKQSRGNLSFDEVELGTFTYQGLGKLYIEIKDYEFLSSFKIDHMLFEEI